MARLTRRTATLIFWSSSAGEDAGSLFHRYFGLQEALEQLFGRKIDLVSASALSNPYFIAAVNKSRQTVYASARAQTA